ncbi:MAG: ECF transporter S component [Clostridia bacterium]|nr:ECF transporter S component [Clostridia bacterium]
MKTNILKKINIRNKTLLTVVAIISAVALPQLAHLIGGYAGLGTSVGEIFLPMHLPVIVAGLVGGPVVGAVAGVLAPVISFALTGMPTAVALPFILVEIFTYGLVSGVMSNVKLNGFLKVLLTQASGRVMRILAVVLATTVFGFEKITLAAVLSSMAMGVVGIIIQWLVCAVALRKKYE